eukprot:720214_1
MIYECIRCAIYSPKMIQETTSSFLNELQSHGACILHDKPTSSAQNNATRRKTDGRTDIFAFLSAYFFCLCTIKQRQSSNAKVLYLSKPAATTHTNDHPPPVAM